MVCGGFIPRAPFRFACANEWHRCAEIRVSPGGWGRNIFLPNRCHSIRWLLGLPGPDPGHFLLVQKVTKNTHRGGTLSMGSLPYVPHPHDDTKGDACPPLESPAGPVVVLASFGNSRGCVPRTMFLLAPPETCPPFTGPADGVSLIDPL